MGLAKNSADLSKTNRSRITNGSSLLRGIDGRSADARRYRDLAMSFADDLGGPDKLSEAESALIRQAAATVVAAERLHAEIVRGDAFDVEQLVRLSNVTSRILTKLGIKRQVRAAALPIGVRGHLAARAIAR